MGLRWTQEQYDAWCRERPARPAAPAPVTPAAVQQGGRPRKYRNEPVVVGSDRFDSKREAAVIAELQQRERAGEIRNLKFRKRECRRELRINDQAVCTYTPDAIYWDVALDREVWLDVKSPATRKDKTYRLKAKLVKAVFGVTITEQE